MILSLEVVLVRDGEALTSINHGFRLSSIIMSYLKKVLIRQGNNFLAHQIETSYVLIYVRNSYLTLVISPQPHPAFKCSFLTLVV